MCMRFDPLFFGYVCLMESVVFHGWYDVLYGSSMW